MVLQKSGRGNLQGKCKFVVSRNSRLMCAVILILCVVNILPAVVFAANSTTPTDTNTNNQAQANWADAIIYFVLVDRFADGDTNNNVHIDRHNPGAYHGGDLSGLTQHLGEIADLGVTAIWINPIVKQVDKGFPAQAPAETNLGSFDHWGFHGYWAEDFNRVNSAFGTEKEMKMFTDTAHAKGIKVLLDVVYNHVGYDAQYLSNPQTKAWIRSQQIDCSQDAIKCQVGGLPDLRTEDPVVREYLFAAHIGLAKRVGVDGFRLDTVKHVEHDFWQLHRSRVNNELGDNFFLLGEVWGGDYQVLDAWFMPDELDAGFDFSFTGNCQSFVNGRGRTVAYAAYMEKRHKVRSGYFLAHYLSSHDEPMALYALGNDKKKFRLCVALQMTSLGIPVIYYGEEVGRGGGLWPTNRNDMPWGSQDILPGKGMARDESLREYYKKLIQIRTTHPALSRGSFKILSSKKDELLVFSREDENSDDAVIVAVNRATKADAATITVPAKWQGESVREALAGGVVPVKAGQISILVPPQEARIYVVQH